LLRATTFATVGVIMRELLTDPHASVLLDPETSVIRFVRTEVPYPSTRELLGVHERAAKLLDRLGRGRYTLLVDMRRGPLNNNPDFEKPAQRARAMLVRGFPRVAVLVQTAVGALQVTRHVRQDNLPILVFHDEAAAVDHLAPRAEPEAAPASRVEVTRDGPFNHLARRHGRR
jgi:hypothetical protein